MDRDISLANFIALGTLKNLEILAHENKCVLWVMNPEYDQPLYISHTYQALWGYQAIAMYQNPRSWLDAIKSNQDGDALWDDLQNNRTLVCPNHTEIICMHTQEGEEKWFQDRSFPIYVDTHDKHMIGGCALHIPSKQALATHQDEINAKIDYVITQYYQLITQVLKPQHVMNPTHLDLLESLSKRELQIFKLIIQGKTAAQVADEIHLSPRTIEGYITVLKEKLQCESKSDLIMKSIDNGWLLLNL